MKEENETAVILGLRTSILLISLSQMETSMGFESESWLLKMNRKPMKNGWLNTTQSLKILLMALLQALQASKIWNIEGFTTEMLLLLHLTWKLLSNSATSKFKDWKSLSPQSIAVANLLIALPSTFKIKILKWLHKKRLQHRSRLSKWRAFSHRSKWGL